MGLAVSWQAWAAFNAFVLAMLALDLGVFHKKAHEVSVKEALTWSGVWVTLALAFNVILWVTMGPQAGLEFFTGYLIEKSLSVDNIFVFVLVFSAFRIPALYQHRVLFWGVLGALLLRGAFIAAGAALLTRFHWVIYLFGVLLAVTGLKMLFFKSEAEDPAQSPFVRLTRRWVPVTDSLHGERFSTREGGIWRATPLLLALLAIEAADLVFALDSIPAIFAVTRDPFIVYTSNVFAILGLRSLYFALSGVVDRLAGLKTGLALVLMFVGGKMLLIDLVEAPPFVSLGAIASLLAVPMLVAAFLARKARLAAAVRIMKESSGVEA